MGRKIFTTENHKQPIRSSKVLSDGGTILGGIRFTKAQNLVASKMTTTAFVMGLIIGGIIVWVF